MATLPEKSNLNGNITAGTYKEAIGMLHDCVKENKEFADTHNADLAAHAALLRLWQPNKAYIVGDTYRPLSQTYPSWMFLECIVAGISGTTEPAWPSTNGHEIMDGTAKWRVRDIKAADGVSIGTITPRLAMQPEAGELTCLGDLVSRTAYPDLWAWVQTNAPLITESAWQAQAAVQSSVGYYSSGDGSTTFRLPKILDYVRGASSDIGSYQADDYKSHVHQVIPENFAPYSGLGGGGTGRGWFNSGSPGNTLASGGTETRPKTIMMLYCVKAFGATTNQGVVDITELAALLNNKISKTDIGYGTQVWVSAEYSPVLNTPTVVTHGLTLDPAKCKCDVLLKCVVAQGGYSVGDYAICPIQSRSSGIEFSLVPALSATTVQINTSIVGLYALNKANGSDFNLTLANWRYVFRIWY